MEVPVLIYHDVLSPDAIVELGSRDRYYSLELEQFLNHLKYLHDNAFETISYRNVNDRSKKPVLLTFDDSYESNYQCFNLLRAFGFNATFFVVTNFVGRHRYLNWDQLQEMHEGGMNIQSHTCSHPVMTEISLNKLQFEFAHSKRIIEEKLKNVVDSISIPQGFFNADVINIAEDCGYKYIFTSEPGLYDTEDGQIVRRLSIYNRTTMLQFKKLVNKDFIEIKKQQLYKSTLNIPKRVLGVKNYHSLRLRILDKQKP